MRPDWESVRQLLVVSLLDQDHQSVLGRVLPLLQQTLPQVSITVLAESTAFSANEQFSTLSVISLSFPFSDSANHASHLIQILKERSFGAAILLTLPQQSPYLVAYCCYLAGIPIRVGQSCEFGGGVLSHWIKPPIDPVDGLEYQLHLLRSIELISEQAISLGSSAPSPIQSADVAVI